MWTIFKVFIFVTVLFLLVMFLFWGHKAMWDLNSPARDRTHITCTGR